jgi:hypothetical protein
MNVITRDQARQIAIDARDAMIIILGAREDIQLDNSLTIDQRMFAVEVITNAFQHIAEHALDRLVFNDIL